MNNKLNVAQLNLRIVPDVTHTLCLENLPVSNHLIVVSTLPMQKGQLKPGMSNGKVLAARQSGLISQHSQ